MAETYLMDIHLVDQFLHLETTSVDERMSTLTKAETLVETPTMAVTENAADLPMVETMDGIEREAPAQDELRNTRNLKYLKCLQCLKHLSETHRPYRM